MANTVLFESASETSPGTEGPPVNMNGGEVSIDIQAAGWGTDGKVVLKARSNYSSANVFKTLEDSKTLSGLAEYSANTSSIRLSLPAGWQVRADFEITTGTATNILVVMGG